MVPTIVTMAKRLAMASTKIRCNVGTLRILPCDMALCVPILLAASEADIYTFGLVRITHGVYW